MEWCLPGARAGWGGGEQTGQLVFNRYRVLVLRDEKFSEVGVGGNGCATV